MRIVLVVAFITTSAYGLGFKQSASVTGRLMCHNRPAGKVQVKLYDDDSGPDLDDLMDSGYSDDEGRFTLSGSETEFTSIDPKVNIYHDCDDELTPCQRRITIFIPSKYVSYGDKAERQYDMGTVQLAGKYSGETRDCLHRH